MISRREPVLALLASIVGGAAGAAAFFAGLGFWGLAVGAALTITLMALTAHLDPFQPFWPLVGWGLAFATLTWPLLWIGYAVLTGHRLGS